MFSRVWEAKSAAFRFAQSSNVKLIPLHLTSPLLSSLHNPPPARPSQALAAPTQADDFDEEEDDELVLVNALGKRCQLEV